MELPRSWYPLCSSAAVMRGRTVAVPAFGTRFVVFRRADGALGVVPARCPHFGADLTSGAVVDGHLRCPLHGRDFAVDGTCRQGGPGSGTAALTVIERWGIVFAAVGFFVATGNADPEFAMPEVAGDQRLIASHVVWQTAPIAVDTIGANAFDTAHLAQVHARELQGDPVIAVLSPWAIRIAFTARVAGRGARDRLLRLLGVHSVELETTCWGGNLLVFHHRRVNTWTIHAALPLAEGRTATCTVSLRIRPTSAWGRLRAQIQLAVQHRLIMDFVAEDLAALRGLTSGPVNLDPVRDAGLIAWRQHRAALPVFLTRLTRVEVQP